MEDRDDTFSPPKVTVRTFLEPLLLLKEKDIFVGLFFGGVVYAIWSMVTSSTTGIFKQAFQLNELLLGLAFIPNGTFMLLAFLLWYFVLIVYRSRYNSRFHNHWQSNESIIRPDRAKV